MPTPVFVPAELDAPALDAAGLAGSELANIDHSGDYDMIDAIVGLDRCIRSMSALRARAIHLAWCENEASHAASVTGDGSTTTAPMGSEMLTLRAFVAEIAAALTISERAADNLVAESRVLATKLPATMTALAEGEISYRHAQIMIDHGSGLPADKAAELEEIALANVSTPRRFDRRVRTACERLDPGSIVERSRRAIDERDVTVDPGKDGMAWLTAHLPAPTALAIHDRLTKGALAPHDKNDERTLAQRRADLLSAALLGSVDSATDLACLQKIVPTVVLAIPALTLLGQSDELATLEGYGPIDPETARRLAGRAKSFVTLLTHPVTGAALSVGRKRYKVPKALRTYLVIRDGTCRFIGCNRRAERCDIDHTREWQHGGGTDHDNLAHLCRHHHSLKGETAWSVTQHGGDGILTWTSPSGRSYTTQPERPFAPVGQVPSTRQVALLQQHAASRPEPPPSADPTRSAPDR